MCPWQRQDGVGLKDMEFVVDFDLSCGDPCLNVIVFMEVCTSEAFRLKVFDNKGMEAYGEICSCEGDINFS